MLTKGILISIETDKFINGEGLYKTLKLTNTK